MNLGLRPILLAVAAILFLVAALGDASGDLIAIGLALLALGLAVDDLGVGRRVSRR